ncbi:unnamed protein product [Enterobius vermicularis]|uniref:HTH CENPB-type domain-containing protein n=1 Tax=Enterobius vermicularis TaxID=51028 RepID=A0A0N4VNE1_ENTVE|nr:unnamed protein product [Enterobius vermicularis]
MDLSRLTTPSTVPSPITAPYSYHPVPNSQVTKYTDSSLFTIPTTTLAKSGSWPQENTDYTIANSTAADFLQNNFGKHCNPNILYRPTPIHPISGSFYSVSSNFPDVDDNTDLPLDLSRSGKNVVAEKFGKETKHEITNRVCLTPKTLLPTCTKSNTNWIASKLSPNRMSYPREFKLMVINYYHRHGQNKYRTCKEFQITKSMLNGWLQKLDKIIQSRPGSLKSGRSGRKPQFPNIEKQLFHLYCKRLQYGQKIGNRWIRDTAKSLAQQQCSQQELTGMCRFSERWLSNFKKRYHINLHRKWTTGTASISSIDSASSESSGTENHGQLSPIKSENSADYETSEMEDSALDCESYKSESPDLLNESEEMVSQNESLIFGQEQAKEVLNKPGQPPILTFYERYPWLCKKNNTGTEPGRRGRKVQFPNVERILFDRLQAKHNKGERVSNRWLQEQARELAMKLCPEVLQEATKSARCLFSEHWLHNFKKRYDVSLKPSVSSIKSSASNQCTSVLPSASSPYENSVESIPFAVQQQSSALEAYSQTSNGLHNWFLSRCQQEHYMFSTNFC